MSDKMARATTAVSDLSILKLADRRIISPVVLNRAAEVGMEVDAATGSLVVALESYLAVDHLASPTIHLDRWIEEYASWWQHTKAVHFPTLSRWLRRPPRMARRNVGWDVEVRQFVGFPELPVYPEQLGTPIRIEKIAVEEL